MAFRKTFRRTFGRKRFATKGALARKASKRFDRVVAHQGFCDTDSFPVSACGSGEDASVVEPSRIVLLSDSVKEQFFEDDCTVVRIEARLRFQPTYTVLGPIDTEALVRTRFLYRWIGGFRVINQSYLSDPVTIGPGAQDDPIPAPLSFENDRTDLRWIKRKYVERFQVDTMRTQFHMLGPASIVGVCSDVSAAGAGAPANTLSSGSGTINIPAISTDCSAFPLGGSDVLQQVTVFDLPTALPHHSHNVTSRQRLRLRNKQALVYDFETLVPFEFSDANPLPRDTEMEVSGYIDLTVET